MSQPEPHDPDCLFCRVARGDIPVHTVYEDEQILVFPDRAPIGPGHLLILAKGHYPYFEDLPPALAAHIVQTGQHYARWMKTHYGVERVGFFFTGIHVPHTHGHVVPMFTRNDLTSPAYIVERDLTFRTPDILDDGALAQTAALLRGAGDPPVLC